MSTFTINRETVLEVKRCTECRRWFAQEQYTPWRCGMCAEERNKELHQEAYKASKTISALRGALTRKGKR